MSYLYFISDKEKKHIKIGVSKDPKKRLKQLQTGSWSKLSILRVFELKNNSVAYRTEAIIHKKFRKSRLIGEWFIFTKSIQGFMESFEPNMKNKRAKLSQQIQTTSMIVGMIITAFVIAILYIQK